MKFIFFPYQPFRFYRGPARAAKAPGQIRSRPLVKFQAQIPIIILLKNEPFSKSGLKKAPEKAHKPKGPLSRSETASYIGLVQ
jgi:hypothetical protein